MNTDDICPILLNNLPYVAEFKHLGNTLKSAGSMSAGSMSAGSMSAGSMSADISCKRAEFILIKNFIMQ